MTKEWMTSSVAVRDSGSFRDPSGSVFHLEGAVYRAVDESTYALMRKLHADGLLDKLAADRLVVRTEPVMPDSDLETRLRQAFPDGRHFLSHAAVPFISYPYEWSLAMLAEAAILHLDLQTRLLAHGYALKDATAYNVAFVGTQPLFMDLPSIEIPSRYDVWTAYGQFCRMFLYPILLQRCSGIPLRQSFLGDIEGPSVSATRAMLGLWKALRPAALVDVFLQNLLHDAAERRIARRTANGATAAKRDESRRRPAGPAASAQTQVKIQTVNLSRLRNKILRLTGRDKTRSAWADYETTHSYDPAGEEEKLAFVKTCLAAENPRTVLDLGCNTGRYARLAAEAGASVVAVDGDPDCIDVLYRRARAVKLDILPLCMNVVNPSPALGFRHRERKSFEQRAGFDGLLALALVHHLLVSARVPLPEVRDLLAALTHNWLIVEFVAVHDPMFRQLLATREDYYRDLTPELFESTFSAVFDIEQKQAIMNGRRILYLMRRRGKRPR